VSVGVMNDYKPEIVVYYESMKRKLYRNRFGVLISGLIKALYQENRNEKLKLIFF
jgi:hypothetical protein